MVILKTTNFTKKDIHDLFKSRMSFFMEEGFVLFSFTYEAFARSINCASLRP